MNAPRRTLSFATAGLAALAALSLVACGSDDDNHADTVASVDSSAAATVIEVDADSGTPGTQTVALGTPVKLHIVSATEHEFHLHGYDIEDEGTDVTINFVADQAGSFEVETHDTEEVIFTLVVDG